MTNRHCMGGCSDGHPFPCDACVELPPVDSAPPEMTNRSREDLIADCEATAVRMDSLTMVAGVGLAAKFREAAASLRAAEADVKWERACKDAFENAGKALKERAEAAESRLEKMKPYLQHMPRCGTFTTTTGANCTCGLTLLED